MPRTEKTPSLARHAVRCAICRHPARAAIEEKFVEWIPQSRIAREHRVSAVALRRHVKACGDLLARRDANLRSALARYIEHGFSLRPTPTTFVTAIATYGKLDNLGRTIERTQNVNSAQAQFSKMSRAEMLEYARTGNLPEWWVSDRA
jgi:hypothetical protein